MYNEEILFICLQNRKRNGKTQFWRFKLKKNKLRFILDL